MPWDRHSHKWNCQVIPSLKQNLNPVWLTRTRGHLNVFWSLSELNNVGLLTSMIFCKMEFGSSLISLSLAKRKQIGLFMCYKYCLLWENIRDPWRPSPTGLVKINFDGAMRSSSVTLTSVYRDHKAGLLHMCTENLVSGEPLWVEAQVDLFGIKRAKEEGFSSIIL